MEWKPSADPPYLVRRWPVRVDYTTVDPYALTLQEPLPVDKWGYPIEQPYLTVRPIVGESHTTIDPYSLMQAEIIRPDKWYERGPDYRWSAPQWQYLYPSYLAEVDLTHVPKPVAGGESMITLGNYEAVPGTIGLGY